MPRSHRLFGRSLGSAARISLPALALAALAGCSTLGLDSKDADKASALACPKVAILKDLASVTQFPPNGRVDGADVLTRAALADFTGGCEVAPDGVTVSVNLKVVAERGPAMQGNRANYRYFVAVIQPDDQILARQEFDTAIDFPPGLPRAGSLEELSQKIPLAKGANAKDWKVFLGFSLSEEQLRYNRALTKR